LRKLVYLVLLILFFASKPGTAQNIDSLSGKIENLPGNFLAKIQKKYSPATLRMVPKNCRLLS
jgi:hypothetical protein